MKKASDYSLEDLLVSSKSLIDKLGGQVEQIIESETLDGSNPAGEMSASQFVESEEAPTELLTDGYVEIALSGDELTVTADFYPASEDMQIITPDTVSLALSGKNVCYGVDQDVIDDAVFRCNTEQTIITDVVIARGIKPANEIPEHWVLEEKLLEKKPVADENALRVDYKEVSPFNYVKKGDILATLCPKSPGVEGHTVRGLLIPFGTAKVRMPHPGRNTEIVDGKVIASCDGIFYMIHNSFWINQVLDVHTDVDYHTGNIDFQGDIIVKGSVKDGFKVKCGGSLFCLETIEAAEISTGNDLTASRGIVGRKKGKLRAGGSIHAKFIEYCFVEAVGSIFIETGIINSSVNSLEDVTLGKKGIIIGGTIHAQNGLKAYRLGTDKGPKTEIYCGIDYTVQQKLEWIRDKSVEIATQLKQVRDRLKRPGQEFAKLQEAEGNLRGYLSKLNEAANVLVMQLDKNEDAEVIVTGDVYPDVYIEICHVSYIVTRKLSHVKFRLDKKSGKIVARII